MCGPVVSAHIACLGDAGSVSDSVPWCAHGVCADSVSKEGPHMTDTPAVDSTDPGLQPAEKGVQRALLVPKA